MTDHYSSNDFLKGSFPPHGHVEILGGGSIVHSRVEGLFNVEAILANNRARLAFLQEHPHIDKFVNLAVITQSVLASPEAIQAHHDGLQEAYRNNFRPPAAVAWLAVGEVEGFDLLAGTYSGNFAAVGVPMRTFKDRALAENWLADFLSVSA